MADEPIATLFNVLRVNRAGLVFFKGEFTSDIAKQITQVHVFEASKSNHVAERVKIDDKEGYQRPALKKRQNDFAKYLERQTEDTTFSPPVILNARGEWRFEALDGRGDLGNLRIMGPANIIDGQHRLGGYISHFADHETLRRIDFIVYESLSSDQEKWVFHTINTNQKGVPAALSVIINDTEWHNRVARKIAEDSSSPFADKISMAGQPGPNYLWKLSAVARNVERMFRSKGVFEDTTEEAKYDLFVEYWEMISDTHATAWEDIERTTRERTHKLLELTGLIAYSRLFEARLSNYYNRTTDRIDWQAVRQDLEELAGRLDLEKKGAFMGMTGEYGAGQIYDKMRAIFAQPQD